MKLLESTVEFIGPAAIHNMPCAVLGDKHAVYNCNEGVFHPSWDAQAKGWQLVRARTWLQRLLLRVVFNGTGDT